MSRSKNKEKTEETIFQFSGFSYPQYTQVPNQIFDELLARLTGAEIKVLLYICRHTYGYQKESDNISLNQMMKGIVRKSDGARQDGGTGISKPTLLRALKSLCEMKIIIAEKRASAKKGNKATNYRLHIQDPLGKKTDQGGDQNFTKPLGTKIDQEQKKTEKQKIKRQAGNAAAFQSLGIDRATVNHLFSSHDGSYIAQKLGYLHYLQEDKPDKLTNPRGWLLKAIEDDYGPPAGYEAWIKRKRQAAKRANMVEETRRFSEKLTKRQNQQVEKRREEERAALATLQDRYGATAEELAVWQDILAELKKATNGMAYAVAKSVHLVAIQDEKAIFASNNSFSTDRIREEKIGSLLVEMFQQRGYAIQEMVAVTLDGSVL